MPPSRICSECPTSLKGSAITAKTCSPSCRAKRSRRLKRLNKEAGEASALPEHQKEISERVRNEMPDIAHRVIEEEIRPVVRESITADTLAAIAQMVGLTNEAVRCIAEDLQSEDAVVRQRAYTLIMKYTVGHQAIVRPPEEEKGGDITVNFELPRPELNSESISDNEEIEAVEIKTCDACGENKPAVDFVANSTRCTNCYETQQNRVAELLADNAPTD